MIVKKLPKSVTQLNIYPIGDLHIGSAEFNLQEWKRWIEHIKNDPFGYVVIVGDMMNCAFKNSKSNVYEDVLSPQEQKEWLVQNLYPIKDKILAILAGNHPQRATRELGYHPMYDVALELGIGDTYRENLFILKVNYGERNKLRQHSCCICGHHGASKNKLDKFQLALDNIDLFVSGHTHDPIFTSPAKICVDLHNEKVTVRTFKAIVVNSFLKYGGYGIEKAYMPKCAEGIQYATFKGNNERVELHWL